MAAKDDSQPGMYNYFLAFNSICNVRYSETVWFCKLPQNVYIFKSLLQILVKTVILPDLSRLFILRYLIEHFVMFVKIYKLGAENRRTYFLLIFQWIMNSTKQTLYCIHVTKLCILLPTGTSGVKILTREAIFLMTEDFNECYFSKKLDSVEHKFVSEASCSVQEIDEFCRNFSRL